MKEIALLSCLVVPCRVDGLRGVRADGQSRYRRRASESTPPALASVPR